MEKRQNNMEKKINRSLEVFKRVYFKDGILKTDDELEENLENVSELSSIVGNNSFSPTIKRVPVYRMYRQYKGWGEPNTYKKVLGISLKVNDGIKENVSSYNMNEITVDVENLSENEIVEKVKEILSLSNKQVIDKFNIDYSIFSKESLKIMEEIDMKNELIRKNEENI